MDAISPTLLLQRIRQAGLKQPETLTLMITGSCNLRCRHCWLQCEPADGASPVATESLIRLIGQWSELEGKRLFLTGGEPLTHPDWQEILRLACEETTLTEICVQTNGVLLDAAKVQVLKNLPSSRLSLQLSFDGGRPATHDRVRGQGSFDAALAGLRLLVDAGLGPRTTLAFTEMRHNFDDLSGLVKLVARMGLRGFRSGTLVKGGRARDIDWLQPPGPRQIEKLLARYHEDTGFKHAYNRVGNIAAIEWFRAGRQPSSDTCACIQTPFISSAGKMYPCVMLLDDKLAAEGLHEQSMLTAIASRLPAWAHLSRVCRERRPTLPPACETCAGREHCGGGCPGRAHAVYGDVLAVEDRCDLRQAAYGFHV